MWPPSRLVRASDFSADFSTFLKNDFCSPVICHVFAFPPDLLKGARPGKKRHSRKGRKKPSLCSQVLAERSIFRNKFVLLPCQARTAILEKFTFPIELQRKKKEPKLPLGKVKCEAHKGRNERPGIDPTFLHP